MANQIFPGVEDVLTILMAELPDGVFAVDRADDDNEEKRSYSSSELRAHAQLLAILYSNLSDINSDKALTSVTTDGLASWEKDLFATAQDGSLDYSTRQANLLSKLRANGGISLPAIRGVVDAILTPQGLAFEILVWCGQSNGTHTGAWVLEVSHLDVDTYLSFLDPLNGSRQDAGFTPLSCSRDYAAAGLTLAQLREIEATAYTYEVKIYGNADANTLAVLDRQLTALEPARSTHVITNNATMP